MHFLRLSILVIFFNGIFLSLAQNHQLDEGLKNIIGDSKDWIAQNAPKVFNTKGTYDEAFSIKKTYDP